MAVHGARALLPLRLTSSSGMARSALALLDPPAGIAAANTAPYSINIRCACCLLPAALLAFGRTLGAARPRLLRARPGARRDGREPRAASLCRAALRVQGCARRPCAARPCCACTLPETAHMQMRLRPCKALCVADDDDDVYLNPIDRARRSHARRIEKAGGYFVPIDHPSQSPAPRSFWTRSVTKMTK